MKIDIDATSLLRLSRRLDHVIRATPEALALSLNETGDSIVHQAAHAISRETGLTMSQAQSFIVVSRATRSLTSGRDSSVRRYAAASNLPLRICRSMTRLSITLLPPSRELRPDDSEGEGRASFVDARDPVNAGHRAGLFRTVRLKSGARCFARRARRAARG